MTAQDGMARWRGAALAAALVLVLACAGWLTHGPALRLALDDMARRGDTTLQLALASLRGQLERFERLPALIATQPLVRALAEDPQNAALVDQTNAYLSSIQRMLGASDVYLMGTDGVTLAASNHDTDTSFVGGNFAFRPYFTDAIRGGEGRFYALGTTSGVRGYYFGAPVQGRGGIAGVLVFKIDLDAIEETWRAGDDAILVTDPQGVVFLSSRADWLFTALEPPDEDARAVLAATRRYAGRVVGAAPLSGRERWGDHQILSGEGVHYQMRSMAMPEADWTLRVMMDVAPARRQALVAAAMAVLALGLGAMVTAVVLQRRARLRERLEFQQAARADLERRVDERTHQLATVNRRLEGEVAERRLAEAHLRKAQADLVQAGKMAALGQMSAALSHEFNQPLAAARTYADNAGVLLDRGRVDDARGNIGRILGLIDRMTSISRHLHSFARKPGQRLGHVSLPEVVETAREIAAIRMKAAGVDLAIDLPQDLPQVVAGPVRLAQVLVNILTNAADAVEGTEDRRIHLTADAAPGTVTLTIRDHGPGVPPAVAARIFDPFFSTKGVGKGLGLGLSISYNIVKDFGGDLTVQTPEGGGAAFRVTLRRAEAQTPSQPEAA